MMPEGERIAQPRHTMFERNIGHMGSRGREVALRLTYQSEPVIGFFAGIDEGYVQLCLTIDQTLETFSREHVVSVKETGRTINDLQREGVDEQSVERLRKKIEHFQKKMSYTFQRKSQQR